MPSPFKDPARRTCGRGAPGLPERARSAYNRPLPEDALFAYLRTLRGDRPWGSVLDAGTGWSSLDWVCDLPTDRLTAVTACPRRAEDLRRQFAPALRPADRVLVGNWVDEDLLRGEVFTVVLADYLVGAVDRFAPYFQSRLLERLKRHVGEVLYLVGLEPYGDADSSPDASLVTRIANLRDAALLHAQDRPHREYPRWWVIEELQRRGYRIVGCRSFPISYGKSFVEAELDACREALARVPRALAQALKEHERHLRAEALLWIRRKGPLRWGSDYVIEAVPLRTAGTQHWQP